MCNTVSAGLNRTSRGFDALRRDIWCARASALGLRMRQRMQVMHTKHTR